MPKEKAYGLSQSATGFLEKNLVGKRDLRKFAGQASFIAGLVRLLRPFLPGIWAALKEPVAQKGPVLPGRMRTQAGHVVWTRQVERSLRWVRAFLDGTAGAPLVRIVHLGDRKSAGRFKASVDASPWGIGGLLQDGNRAVAKFYDRVSPEDVDRLGIVIGDPAHLTVLEGVAILVAVRVFAPVAAWMAGSLASLHVRSDSKGALGAAVKGASTSDPIPTATA